MSKYAAQIASAQRLLKKKGKLLTFTHAVAAIPANIDLATDTETPAANPATTTASGWGVTLPPNAMTQQTFESQFADGSLTLSKVRRLLFSPVGMAFLPQAGDTVVVGGVPWTLLGGKYLSPDDTTPILGEFTIKL